MILLKVTVLHWQMSPTTYPRKMSLKSLRLGGVFVSAVKDCYFIEVFYITPLGHNNQSWYGFSSKIIKLIEL